MPIVASLSRGCKKDHPEQPDADLKQVCEAADDK